MPQVPRQLTTCKVKSVHSAILYCNVVVLLCVVVSYSILLFLNRPQIICIIFSTDTFTLSWSVAGGYWLMAFLLLRRPGIKHPWNFSSLELLLTGAKLVGALQIIIFLVTKVQGFNKVPWNESSREWKYPAAAVPSDNSKEWKECALHGTFAQGSETSLRTVNSQTS